MGSKFNVHQKFPRNLSLCSLPCTNLFATGYPKIFSQIFILERRTTCFDEICQTQGYRQQKYDKLPILKKKKYIYIYTRETKDALKQYLLLHSTKNCSANTTLRPGHTITLVIAHAQCSARAWLICDLRSRSIANPRSHTSSSKAQRGALQPRSRGQALGYRRTRCFEMYIGTQAELLIRRPQGLPDQLCRP